MCQCTQSRNIFYDRNEYINLSKIYANFIYFEYITGNEIDSFESLNLLITLSL